MYRQIFIHLEDQDLQWILWRTDASDRITEYRWNTVTHGLACTPFLATLRQLADDEKSNYSRGAEVLCQDIYIDDILTGGDTMKETLEIQRQLIPLCKASGFPLRKWAANRTELLKKVPPAERVPLDPRFWQPHHSCTMLGLRWHPNCDSFSFTFNTENVLPVIKRTILFQLNCSISSDDYLLSLSEPRS